jgi:UDP-3-O-[3-hydroxymyristoyl] N-acetylglucosamine deacetylase
LLAVLEHQDAWEYVVYEDAAQTTPISYVEPAFVGA